MICLIHTAVGTRFAFLVKPVLPENMPVGGKTILSIIDSSIHSKGGLITPAPQPPHNPSIFWYFRTKKTRKASLLPKSKIKLNQEVEPVDKVR